MLHRYYPNNYLDSSFDPYYEDNPYPIQAPLYYCPYAAEEYYRIPDMLNKQGMPSLPNSWTFGPVKVEWTFSGESINVVLKVFEKAIRDLALTLSKPTVSITTTIGDTTINLKVSADFVKNQISLAGAICMDTVCTTFNNTVIAKW